jgi:hypothetical protein
MSVVLIVFFVLALLLWIGTLVISIRHERRLKNNGAIEYGATNSIDCQQRRCGLPEGWNFSTRISPGHRSRKTVAQSAGTASHKGNWRPRNE